MTKTVLLIRHVNVFDTVNKKHFLNFSEEAHFEEETHSKDYAWLTEQLIIY